MSDYTRLDRNMLAAFATSPRMIRALEDLQKAAYEDNPALVQEIADEIADKQQASVKLDALSGLGAPLGLVEKDGADTFNLRTIGVGGASAIPTRSDADARYVRQDIGAAFTAPTGTASRAGFATYTAPVITNPPTTAEVQAVADALQTISQHLKAVIDDLQANGGLT